MSEFRVVRRGDVPRILIGRHGMKTPAARLHKSGTLFLNVHAIEGLKNGHDSDFPVLLEFDEQAMTIKLTAVDEPPRGITEDDLFMVRLRMGSHSERPQGTLYLKGLLRHIGIPVVESIAFPVTDFDPVKHSISIKVPLEPMPCDGSSN